jgi:uncharacterized protein YjiK
MASKKKTRANTLPTLPLEALSQASLGVPSASAVAPLGGGLYLIVNDDEGLFLAGGPRPIRLRDVEEHEALGDLESVCVSDDGAHAYAVSEESGEVFSFEVQRTPGSARLAPGVRLGEIERPGDKKNKGWEGVAFLPAGFAEGWPSALVVAHEGKPMALGFYALPDLRELHFVDLDDTLDGLLGDVADVTLCPRTGHLFLLSDQSHRIVEARISPSEVELLASFDLTLDDDEKPEGIAFETEDVLVVVTDHSSQMLRFRLGA